MSRTLTFSPGVGPDVAVRDGQVHLTWGHSPWVWLVLSRDGALLGRSEQPVGYYPKTNGALALTHDGERFVCWPRGEAPSYPDGVPQGVHATGVSPSGQRFFYRKGDGVFTQTGAYCENIALPNPYASYGWWESRDDGTGRTWDECYYGSKPAGTGQIHHEPNGRLSVSENGSGGVLAIIDGVQALLWPGEDTRWPRCSVEGELVAICCWGDPGPQVRVWIGTVDELKGQGVPEVVLPPVPPSLAGRTLELAYFHSISDRYGDNRSAPCHATIVLTADEAARSPWPYYAEPGLAEGPRKLGEWVNVPRNSDWPEGPATRVYIYDGGEALPELPSHGITALEVYSAPGAPLAVCETALRQWLSRWPTAPVILVGQAYTRNGQETDRQKLADLQGLPLRLAADYAQVKGVWWFADMRPTGTRDNEWWRPVHDEAFATVRNPHAMSNHLDTVQTERAKYGTPLGNANAWAVINATAYTWKGEGWGLLDKPSGNNYQGYSVDVIINTTTKELVDCLQDSEGAGNPVWNLLPWDDSYASRWRAPLPPEGPPDPPVDELEARVAALESRVGTIERALAACGEAMP